MLPLLIKKDLMSIRTGAESDCRQKRRHNSQDIWNQFYHSNITHNIYQTPQHKRNKSKKLERVIECSINEEIKELDKKIRKCKKEIEKQKNQSKLQKQVKFIRNIAVEQYEFITNPLNPEEDQEKEERDEMPYEAFQTEVPYQATIQKQTQIQKQKVERILQKLRPRGKKFILQKTVVLQNHYVNDLRKKFQRRDKFPHQVCRRRIPKLNITEHNKVQKYGHPQTLQQHLFRVLTKQATPTEIYPTIPTFQSIRDNVSKNVLAYLSDYAPFVQKISKL